jgi:hypothetical protein
MKADCVKRARNGVLDMTYLERRLDSIEARIDDLCGLLGEVLERLGVDSVPDSLDDLPIEAFHGPDCTCGRH